MEDLWKWIESNADALLVVVTVLFGFGAASWAIFTYLKAVKDPQKKTEDSLSKAITLAVLPSFEPLRS